MKKIAALTAILALSGCRGTVPQAEGGPERGLSAILVGCRIILPTGETRKGGTTFNLEGQHSGSREIYRVPVYPGNPMLYQVEPGTYRLAPTRNLFGLYQSNLKVSIEGRNFSVPFPRDLLRKESLVIKPAKILSIGVVEVTVSERMPGRPMAIKVSLNDSVEARRGLVQDIVRKQMDPQVPAELRVSAIEWTRALEQTLSELLSESQRNPSFRAVP